MNHKNLKSMLETPHIILVVSVRFNIFNLIFYSSRQLRPQALYALIFPAELVYAHLSSKGVEAFLKSIKYSNYLSLKFLI